MMENWFDYGMNVMGVVAPWRKMAHRLDQEERILVSVLCDWNKRSVSL